MKVSKKIFICFWKLNIAGYLFTYWHTKLTEERRRQIDRVNEQLRELYGPLLACITATESAYAAMVASAAPNSTPETFRALIQSNINSHAARSYRRVSSSEAVIAEISVTSPRKIFIFIITKNIYVRSKYPEINFNFEKSFTGFQDRCVSSCIKLHEIFVDTWIQCFYFQKVIISIGIDWCGSDFVR